MTPLSLSLSLSLYGKELRNENEQLHWYVGMQQGMYVYYEKFAFTNREKLILTIERPAKV